MEKVRGQAAIFDGIMFLMLVSFSMAMVFTFLNTYGVSQDNVIRSAHSLNYVQSVMKSIYFIDANTLAEASVVEAGDCFADCQNEINVYGVGMGCEELADWRVTVGDIVKKDLVDGRLDDKFGKDVGEGDELVPAAVAPGKTALRCLFREVMKPFRQAGYNYFVEVLTPTYISLQNFQGEAAAAYNVPAAQNAYPRSWITDSSKIEGELGYNPINGDLHGCDDPRINASALLAISTPFRIQPPAKYDDVYDADVLESYAYPVGAHSGVHPIAAVSPLDYQLRVCIWPAQ